jgi:sugar/nucleoside kinase (ribokinase family)
MGSSANSLLGRLGPVLAADGQVNGVGVVGVGSLFAAEQKGELKGNSSASVVPAGGVAAVTLAAASVGAKAIAASRVGHDDVAKAILDQLQAAGIDLHAVQVDPDFVTPRWIQRGSNVRLEPFGAFDNIQWDADLETLARTAEVIITDACGRRHGQSRSSIDRMLIGAPSAVRIIDLTRRAPTDQAKLDREHVGQALELCDGFVVDAVALRTLVPAVSDPFDAARRLFESRRKGMVALVSSDREEGCVVSLRGLERTPRASGDTRIDGTTISLALGFATVVGRAPHEFVAAL